MMQRIAPILLVLTFSFCLTASSAEDLHYYWPRFPRPETVLTVKSVPSREMAVVLDTLAGLAARDVAQGGGKEMIWAPLGHPSYVRWFTMMMRQTGAREDGPFEIWDLVKRLKERGVVKGYLLYHYDDSSRNFFEDGPMDTSVNAATSLCALHGAIAVSDRLEPDAQAMGLPLLLDVRGMSEEDCYTKYSAQFNRGIIALQDPKANEIRSEAVALGSFVLSKSGPLYERALAGLDADTPVLGWGIGDEMGITQPASEWGHFITATNWCHNLPVLSTERLGVTYPVEKLRAPHPRTLWDLTWEEDVHYATFIMSDGDNVQWLMGDFIEDQYRCYWSDPRRGTLPIGWTCCYVDLAQLCPYALDYLFQTASPQDDFILYGGGYYYPDLFGTRGIGAHAMRTHAWRIGQYMRLGGIQLLAFNAARWDSEAALKAYQTCASEIPDLLGIFAVQYAPYTAGGGAVKWVKGPGNQDVPVVSAKYSIWANTNTPRDNSPRVIAQRLNALPRLGSDSREDAFSWVVVHAWSWFKEAQKGTSGEEEIDQKLGGQPGSARGFASVKSCTDALDPHVKVLTPTEFILRMRLMLRPEQTLEDLLKGLRESLKKEGKTLSAEKQSEANRHLNAATQCLRDGRFPQCFEHAKQAHVLTAGVTARLG